MYLYTYVLFDEVRKKILLPSSFNLNDVDYLISKTTKEAGSGAVLLFTAFQLLETNPEARL